MRFKDIKDADTQNLINEYKKYERKRRDVLQQLDCIDSYMFAIDYELTLRDKKRRDNNEPYLPPWKKR